MKVVSLFAGCGGLDLGFEQAGFKIVWANENDESIYATYRLNHPNTFLNTNDIRTLSGNNIPDCDGIIGGPPCQAWSEGGKRLGVKDVRGQLFYEYIRIVKEKKPKFFVIENVKGILDKKHRGSLNSFITLLIEAGYRITYELLNAADYKIPQDRFRVFFVGIRQDLINRYEFPDPPSTIPVTLRQAIGDILEKPRFFKDEKIETQHPYRLNHDVYSGPYDAKYMARNRVRSWDEPSFTIQAQARNAPQHPQAPNMTFVSSTQRIFARGYEYLYRRLSVRECARIQTFPDSFQFLYSDIKDGYKMVGNAVPPRLAWFIAAQIKKAFTESTGIISERKLTSLSSISIKQLVERHPNFIIKNKPSMMLSEVNVDLSKRVLISLVKSDIKADFEDGSARFYYTGKKFPISVALNKLYYFMPYLKGKGIRDLYYVKVVRLGTKKELYPECEDNDARLVFEIEFIKHLFIDYQPVHLNIWRTFTDTTMNAVLKIKEIEESV